MLDQKPALQIEVLKVADCERIFTEKVNGVQCDRSQLKIWVLHLGHAL